MTTERNAQGVDGLAEVMGLLGKATLGEWQATVEVFDKGGWAAPVQHITVYAGEEFITTYSTDYAEYPDDKQNTANAGAFTAAVNYLCSHGEAIRELVEAARAARAYSTIPSTQFRELIKTMGWDGAEDTARFVSRLLDAALAKFPEPRP